MAVDRDRIWRTWTSPEYIARAPGSGSSGCSVLVALFSCYLPPSCSVHTRRQCLHNDRSRHRHGAQHVHSHSRHPRAPSPGQPARERVAPAAWAPGRPRDGAAWACHCAVQSWNDGGERSHEGEGQAGRSGWQARWYEGVSGRFSLALVVVWVEDRRTGL